jgi:hypothetical protein
MDLFPHDEFPKQAFGTIIDRLNIFQADVQFFHLILLKRSDSFEILDKEFERKGDRGIRSRKSKED